MRVAVAGHRWNRIDPETESKHLADLLRNAMKELPCSESSVTLVTGMAEGTDLTAAAVRPSNWQLEAALALPEPSWREHLDTAHGVRSADRAIYRRLIQDATVIAVGATCRIPDYTAVASHLASTCTHILTVWNGLEGPPGGTSDVVNRANRKRRPVINLWDPLVALRHQP
jgi:hypothetical protein